MKGNRIKIHKAIKLLAAFFLREKKLYTEHDYIALGNRQPVAGTTIRYIFGGYPGMITCMKQSAYWGELKQLNTSKPSPKPVEPVAAPQVEVPKPVQPKPAPKAAVKPAVKPAVTEGKDNE